MSSISSSPTPISIWRSRFFGEYAIDFDDELVVARARIKLQFIGAPLAPVIVALAVNTHGQPDGVGVAALDAQFAYGELDLYGLEVGGRVRLGLRLQHAVACQGRGGEYGNRSKDEKQTLHGASERARGSTAEWVKDM